MMDKPWNNKAWFFVLPVLALVLFSSIVPMMTVVNYSIQDSMGVNNFFWNGDAWFRDLLDPSTEIGARFADALLRTFAFSASNAVSQPRRAVVIPDSPFDPCRATTLPCQPVYDFQEIA